MIPTEIAIIAETLLKLMTGLGLLVDANDEARQLYIRHAYTVRDELRRCEYKIVHAAADKKPTPILGGTAGPMPEDLP